MNQEYLNVQFNKLANNLKKSLEQIDFIQKLEQVQNLEGGTIGTIAALNIPTGPILAGPEGNLDMPSMSPAPEVQIETTHMQISKLHKHPAAKQQPQTVCPGKGFRFEV